MENGSIYPVRNISPLRLRNSIVERFDLLKKLGGLPEPDVINEEWLYILKRRNSELHFNRRLLCFRRRT